MFSDPLADRLRQSLEEMTDQDWDELWEELIRRGVIDSKGRVLKRAPEPPDETPKNGKTKKPTRARKRARRSTRG